jgi:23S rRNA pseudouridine1911/1915/1917 synthase
VGRGACRTRIDAPIGRDPVNRKKMSARARRSREAVTRIRARRALGAYADARARSRSRRAGPIRFRVHLSAIGHPIVGDSLYGACTGAFPATCASWPGSSGPFLHAARLVFQHPRLRRMEFSSVLPDDLQRVWTSSGKEIQIAD